MKTDMINCRGWLLSLFIICCAITSNAQFSYNYVRAADDYYKKGDYFSAAMYYEKALGQKKGGKDGKVDPYVVEQVKKEKANAISSYEQVVYKTGESYRLLNNYVKAEPYYKETANAGSQFPYARYWFAKSLRYNSKFEEAETEFSKFLQDYTSQDSYTEDAVKEVANLKFIRKELAKDISRFTVNKISADGIVHGADYAPSLMSKSTIVFTSTRADSGLVGKNPYINRLYQADAGSSATMSAARLNIPQPADVHQGASSFSAHGDRVFFTRSVMNNGSSKKTSAIYVSEFLNGAWSEPVALTGDVNMDGFNTQHPCVTGNGDYLLYSSDKPGGMGKFDLWMTRLNANSNTTPSVNLGAVINTKEDEEAPYFFEKTETLIFSSNGRVGMGGFDFYQSKGDLHQAWETPVNLGYPVNSVKDDMYMLSKADKYMLDNLFFSSDRASECCLEMYTLNKRRNKKMISGLVVDCKTGSPIEGATVLMMDTISNASIATRITDVQGRYELLLDEYQPIKLTAKAEGYPDQSLSFFSPGNEEVDSLFNPDVCLTKPEPPVVVIEKPFEENKPVVLNNILYEFDKATLKPSSYPMLDSLAALLEKFPAMAIEISGHTDNLGDDDYNMKLSQLRAQSCVNYLLKKDIDISRLEAKGYGETQPVAPNKKANGKDNPAGRQKNRRTEFKVLHY